jgi:hypothetical protein
MLFRFAWPRSHSTAELRQCDRVVGEAPSALSQHTGCRVSSFVQDAGNDDDAVYNSIVGDVRFHGASTNSAPEIWTQFPGLWIQRKELRRVLQFRFELPHLPLTSICSAVQKDVLEVEARTVSESVPRATG